MKHTWGGGDPSIRMLQCYKRGLICACFWDPRLRVGPMNSVRPYKYIQYLIGLGRKDLIMRFPSDGKKVNVGCVYFYLQFFLSPGK